MRLPRASALAVALLATLSSVGSGLAASEAWTIGPPPDWVVPTSVAYAGEQPVGEVPSGIYYLLVDHQVRVRDTAIHYYRRAWTALSSAGVQSASEISLSFDPSYQRLVIHHVRLVRDGRPVGSFAKEDVRVIHAEQDLAERIYDGGLTALVFLKDLRVGDTVDYAYSIEGANPVLGGRLEANLPLAFGTPVRRLRHLVLMPAGRALSIRAHETTLEPIVASEPGGRSYLWEATGVPAVEEEDGEPVWFDAFPGVQVGEFRSWAEVAQWARALFMERSTHSPDVRRLAQQLRSRNAGALERMTAAVRFVQDEVRYLGIEMGPNSLQPHEPEQTLQQRFGDCKDKSLLLVALLRELGTDAAPALVSTRLGRALDARRPSPFVFDHAIVEIQLGQRRVWVDPTVSHQGGRPESWAPPLFERALVLRRGTDHLATIPVPASETPLVEVEERYRTATDGSARLEVRTTYRDREADDARAFFAAETRSDVAKRYLNFYSQGDPEIQSSGKLTIADERDANQLVVSESYALPSFWTDGARGLTAWRIGEELKTPATTIRTAPFALDFPAYVSHRVSVRPAAVFASGACDTDVEAAGLAFSRRCARSDGELRLAFSLRSLHDAVGPKEMKDYLTTVQRIQSELRWQVRAPTAGPGGDALAIWIGLGMLGTATFAGSLWMGARGLRRARRRRAFLRQARLDEGDSPATALRLATRSALEEAVRMRACRCGARAGLAIVEEGSATYDRKPVMIFTLRCPACEAESYLYAFVGESPAPRASGEAASSPR